MEELRENSSLRRKLKEKEDRPGQGNLKIFFGYADGIGTTYAMLEAAHAARRRGVDVVVGYIEPHGRLETASLTNGLESLPSRGEFNLDAAIRRRPELLVVDELAHNNAAGCRHVKRYQDVEELLKLGIDVYTTLNVQHIESLKDTVTSITGRHCEERIPDSVFDHAEQVELIDIEPKELMERIHSGNVCQSDPEPAIPLTQEKLTALRELSLRRCADRVNRLAESARTKSRSEYYTDEHILVCLSPSPSNAKTIRTAARMASAFHCTLTALFVETPDFPAMSEKDLLRLRSNIHLAQQLDAKIETTYGDDVSFQIAEFARLSGVSKIVIGRSAAARRGLFHKPSLADRLISDAPNLDVYIIPDGVSSADMYHTRKVQMKQPGTRLLIDFVVSLFILFITSCVGVAFDRLGFAEANIITIYVLGVLITSVVTTNRFYSLLSSIVSVVVFNFLFTYPRFSLEAYDQGYPVTFLVMFLAAALTGSLATKLKNNAKQSARAAFRTKVLFDSNQMLQQARGQDEIFSTLANQLKKLMDKTIVIYPVTKARLGEGKVFYAVDEEKEYLTEKERRVAEWVAQNNKHAGATTQTLADARCLYLSIRINSRVYGVVGIAVDGSLIDGYENSILLSILGECALALENEKNAREKEEAAILAKNEQLRANLLRAISHDLRTPLTSISGNASNLLSNGNMLDDALKEQVYTDIYNDSMWLINLVENLLSVTRLEEGRLNLNISENLLEDVVEEALRHVNRTRGNRIIKVFHEDELLLAKMDAKLIVQVLINLVDNAIKYTPDGSTITISTERKGDKAVVHVADNGPGIPDDAKERVFDMFYCGANKIADSRRSLGLGLSLCKSIITSHSGTIAVADNTPCGTVFTFTLPVGEVQLHE